MAYIEAIMRVYNLYGRRDNKFKARIKILVHESGRRNSRRKSRRNTRRPDRPTHVEEKELQDRGVFCPAF